MSGKTSFKKFMRKLDGNTESERGGYRVKKTAKYIESPTNGPSPALGVATYQWIFVNEADQLFPSNFGGVEQEDDEGEAIPYYSTQLPDSGSPF